MPTKKETPQPKRIYLDETDLSYDSDIIEFSDHGEPGIPVKRFKEYLTTIEKEYTEKYKHINNLEFTIKYEQTYDDSSLKYIVSYMESESEFKDRIRQEKIKEQEKTEKKAQKIIENQLASLNATSRRRVIDRLEL